MAPEPVSATTPFIDNHAHPDEADLAGAVEIAVQAEPRENAEQIVFMPPPFLANDKEKYDAEQLLEAAKKYPGKILIYGGGGSLNSMLQEAARAGKMSPEVEQEFKKRAEELVRFGVAGFGEMALEHISPPTVSDYQSAPPDHPLMLLLADIAAKSGLPIDIHMEAVADTMPLPQGIKSPPNPPQLPANIAAFEKLLDHNPKAKIIWAHAGTDFTGDRTPELCRQLLQRHLNLYMEIKVMPERPGKNSPLSDGAAGTLKPEWLKLFQDFPDRFTIGTDQHYGPKDKLFAGRPRWAADIDVLNQLPPDVVRKIATENFLRLNVVGEKAGRQGSRSKK